MRDGSEWNFVNRKGPRKPMLLRLPPEVDTLLRVAAADTGLTKQALATRLLAQWAEQRLSADALGEPVDA
jgi:hypothetical protein